MSADRFRMQSAGRAILRGVLLVILMSASFCWCEQQRPRPLVIPLQPFGIPKALFAGGRPLSCFHEHAAGTRMFWLDSSHIFVAFTTNSPCTLKSNHEPGNLRAMVFDSAGAVIAKRDWPIEGDLNLFAGPNHSIILRRGRRLEFLDIHLREVESGELAESPKGLWVTPARSTIPLLSADGRNFEFYSADPLKLVSTIALDQTTEANAVKDWVPGDERIAGSYCTDKSRFTCTKVLVLTPDANFLSPEGEPWSYQEDGKPINLDPIGFLDATHLIVVREDKNFFHSPQLLIVKPNGLRMVLPNAGSNFYPRRIAGVVPDGSRFGLEFSAQGMCEECYTAKLFVVAEPDAKKFIFEKAGSPYFSYSEMSPDGKSMAILDNSVLSLYPLP